MHNNLRHSFTMKFKSSAALMLALILAFGTPVARAADSTQNSQQKSAMDLFHSQVKNRERMRNEIAKSFIEAINTANNAAKKAMRTAKSADAKSVALAQQKSAIRLATATRDAAILAMGPEPIEPTQTNDFNRPALKSESTPTKKSKPIKSRPSPPK